MAAAGPGSRRREGRSGLRQSRSRVMRLSSDRAARRRLALLLTGALTAFVAGVVVGAGGDDEETEPQPAEVAEQAQGQRRERALAAVDRLTLRQQVGQLIVSSFPDPAPPDYIQRRLLARETAGVILFGFNAGSEAEWRRLTRSVQRHARGDALVMVDQEGGEIRAVSWAGPVAGQPSQGDAAAVRRTASATARELGRAGVNVNLAPVADVPGGDAPVMGFRAFDGDARGIAERTRASIEGMRAGGVAATGRARAAARPARLRGSDRDRQHRGAGRARPLRGRACRRALAASRGGPHPHDRQRQLEPDPSLAAARGAGLA